MDKKTFHRRWYFRLLQVIFLGPFIFLILLGIWGILYEDDIPFAGFFWAGVLILAYWLVQKIFYHVIFGDGILPRKYR